MIMCAGMVRIQIHGALVVFPGLVVISHLVQQERQLELTLGIVRIDLDNLLKVALGLLDLTLFL